MTFNEKTDFYRNHVYIEKSMRGACEPLEGINLNELQVCIAFQRPNHYFEIVSKGLFGGIDIVPRQNFRVLDEAWIGAISNHPLREIELHRDNLSLNKVIVR